MPNSQTTTHHVIPTSGPTTASEDELKEAAGSNTNIRNAKDAKTVLEAGQYLIPSASVTPALLALILLQLAQSVPKPPRCLADGIQVISFLLKEITVDLTAETIASAVMAKLTISLKEIQNATEDMSYVTDRIKDAAAKNLAAINSICKDLGDLSEKVTQVSFELIDWPPQNQQPTPTPTPANSTIPPQHAAVVTQGNAKSQQIYVQTNPGMDNNGLKDLTKKELVAKAQIALNLMGLGASDTLEGTTFIGAKKLRTGAIQYQLSSESSMEWIQDKAVMASFMEHFGGTSTARSQL
jgi:hypothetical protein